MNTNNISAMKYASNQIKGFFNASLGNVKLKRQFIIRKRKYTYILDTISTHKSMQKIISIMTLNIVQQLLVVSRVDDISLFNS